LPSGAIEAWQYRAFCLLALQRQDEAKMVIARIYQRDPLYQLSDAQSAPRIRSVFQEVRRTVLPAVVQQEYLAAKAAFERKDPLAAAQFERVLMLLDDPDMKDTVAADLRVVATGFLDLSRATASVAAERAAAAPSAPPPSPRVDPVAPVAANVVMVRPVALSRPMPSWAPLNSTDATRSFSGQLQLSIDETGKVVSAALEAPIYPRYDQELLQYAKRWRFKPATRNGVPTPFDLVVPIQLQQP